MGRASVGVWAHAMLWLCACGTAGGQGRVEQPAPQEQTVVDLDESDEAPEPEAPTPEVDPNEGVPDGCDGLPQAQCAERSGCVFDGSCREASGECENLTPIPSYQPMPGDRCARQNSACALDPRWGFCRPFVAQTTCPATRAEAEQTTVFCAHPNQAALDCSFSGGWCACHPPPPYCGGAPPRPDRVNRPSTWGCVDDTDANGCPTRPIRAGTRCRLPRGQWCSGGCLHMYQCVRGRWRATAVEPRP